MSVQQGVSKKHHFIPVFYLKRWLSAEGKIVEFSRPYRSVVPKKVHPSGTGYVFRGYELRGFEPTLAQQVETKLFKRIDDRAADALALLESGAGGPWSAELRSGWTRFILSLLLRCPEDIAAFRDFWYEDFVTSTNEEERVYQQLRQREDPPTWAEYLAQQPQQLVEKSMFELLIKLLNNREVGTCINQMRWNVISIPPDAGRLLTSDRPIIRTASLVLKQDHLLLPIGPHRLFVATNSKDCLNDIVAIKPRELIKRCNEMTVEAAVRFAFDMDDLQLRFVQNRFGKTMQPRLIDGIAQKRAERLRSGQ